MEPFFIPLQAQHKNLRYQDEDSDDFYNINLKK